MLTDLRVLLITARADHGGGPRHILDLLRAFAGSDITFYMGAPLQEPYAPQFLKLTKKFFEIPAQSFSPFAFFRLLRIVRRARIDIIHSHGRGAGLYSRLLGLLTGCRVLHTFHGIHRDPSFAGRVKLKMDQALSFLPFTPIFVSENEQREAINFHCVRPHQPGYVVENAVDTSRFTGRLVAPFSMMTAGAKSTGQIRIGGFTRPDLAKGPDLFIYLVREFEKEAAWSCAGILSGELASFGRVPETLEILGRIDEPSTWLKSLDVFVSTARNEGLPLGVLEAMASGCVCILSDIPAHRTFAAKGAAILFDAQDPATFQLVLAQVKSDAALRAETLQNADELVHSQHSIESFRKNLEAVYRSTATSETSRPGFRSHSGNP